MSLKLKDLAVEHDYYASGSNYYSNEASTRWNSWPEFYAEFKDADTDMNLVYRWDIHKFDDQDAYYMQIVIIGQRKGLYLPHHISRVFEDDLKTMIPYLKRSYDKLQRIWIPLNDN